MATAAAELIAAIEDRGWRGRIVPAAHLADLEEAVRGPYERGLLAESAYRRVLSYLTFETPADLPQVRSIVVVALPAPQVRLAFGWRGERVPVVVPPTYAGESPRVESVQSALAAWLREAGYRLAKARLPLKTLAVRSGLAAYGRNNICYVPGMGSFVQLVGAYTDLPGDGDPWGEPRALERCASCVACLRRCPTGAIADDRFLLHPERCLTFHNESAEDFPDWIDPSWHHCLVGCMRCQDVCPENKDVVGWLEDRAEFSEAETALFLRRVPLEALPAETAAKVRDLAIWEDFGLLCRNLSMIVGRGRTTA